MSKHDKTIANENQNQNQSQQSALPDFKEVVLLERIGALSWSKTYTRSAVEANAVLKSILIDHAAGKPHQLISCVTFLTEDENA